MIKQFDFKLLNLALVIFCDHFNFHTALFEAFIRLFHVLQHRSREDLEVMDMKEYSTYPKAP